MSILAVTCENIENIQEYRQQGADEIILALENACFSALKTFTPAEIKEAIRACNSTGMRISVLMNRLFHEEDTDRAVRLMKEFIAGGADGIVFADTALMYAALKEGFASKMIYQPETMMTSCLDAIVWGQTGVQAVMISGLLTEEEVLNIASAADNTGMTIHGYQLMSVSARPLLSAFAAFGGTESLKNRDGLTLVEEKRKEHMPVYENEYAAMIFSDYVMESLDEIQVFKKAGMKRFVIDTWHLGAREIADTIRLYRQLLDNTEPDMAVSEYRNRYRSTPLSKGYYDQKTVR